MAFLITPMSNDEETKTTDKLYFQELANYWHLENTWNIHMWESEDGFNLGNRANLKGIMLTRGRDSLLGSRLGVQHR
jgi:hypothetical protein